jgi:hypothetical protein
MEKEELEKNKARFLELCHEHIHREGLEELLAHLEETDFYTAPSSSNFHLNEKGGLCLHSINVFEAAMSIYDNMLKERILSDRAVTNKEIPMESIAIAALFHDLCKMGLYHESERWKKDERGQWHSYQGYEVQDAFPFGHGEKSCLILHCYMKLKPDEMLAIRWHMGMFDMGAQGTAQMFAYRAAMDKTPLVTLMQVADMFVSNCWEKTVKH